MRSHVDALGGELVLYPPRLVPCSCWKVARVYCPGQHGVRAPSLFSYCSYLTHTELWRLAVVCRCASPEGAVGVSGALPLSRGPFQL